MNWSACSRTEALGWTYACVQEYGVQDDPNNIWIEGYKVLQVVGSGTHAVCFLVEEAKTANTFIAKVRGAT